MITNAQPGMRVRAIDGSGTLGPSFIGKTGTILYSYSTHSHTVWVELDNIVHGAKRWVFSFENLEPLDSAPLPKWVIYKKFSNVVWIDKYGYEVNAPSGAQIFIDINNAHIMCEEYNKAYGYTLCFVQELS